MENQIDRQLNNLNTNVLISGNNNNFENYTGNGAYYVTKQISGLEKNKVFYFSCENATFEIKQNGFIEWKKGSWLGGNFYGRFNNGTFWNGIMEKGQFINSVLKGGRVSHDIIFKECILQQLNYKQQS